MYVLCCIVMHMAKALQPSHPTDELQHSSEMSAARPSAVLAGSLPHASEQKVNKNRTAMSCGRKYYRAKMQVKTEGAITA